MFLTLPPAEKALPSPVKMMTFTSGSSVRSTNTSSISRCVVGPKEFSSSGLLIFRTAMPLLPFSTLSEGYFE